VTLPKVAHKKFEHKVFNGNCAAVLCATTTFVVAKGGEEGAEIDIGGGELEEHLLVLQHTKRYRYLDVEKKTCVLELEVLQIC